MAAPSFRLNFIYNVIGALLPVLCALATVPFYIHYIGTARYGIVSITWLLLGYFGFLDFGLSRASANALSRLTSSSERSPVLVTAFLLNFGLGAIGGLILFVAARFLLGHAFHLSGPLEAEAVSVAPWIAVMLPLGMIYGVAQGALESRERFGLSNTFGSTGTMFGQILPLLCAIAFGPSLTVVVPASVLARLLITLITYTVVLRIEWPVRLLDFNPVWVRRLFGYGSWVSVSSIATPVLETFDQMLIGSVLGASAVAYYSVPMNLSMRSQVVATALARSLFPRVSRSSPEEARRTTKAAVVSLAYGFGAICGPGILFCGAFLRLWVGTKFAVISTPIAQMLMLGAWTNGLAFLPYGLLQGQGRPDITAKLHVAQVLPFLLGVWVLMKLLGLQGAAIAWTLRVTIDAVLLYWFSGCISRDILRLLPAVGLMLASSAFALMLPVSLPVSFIAATLAGVAFLGLGVVLDPTLREAAQQMTHKLHRLLRPPATGCV